MEHDSWVGAKGEATQKSWLLELLKCPSCMGELRESGPQGLAVHVEEASELACEECQTRYPVLAGIPFLLPDPSGYMASYREAVLASLAEAGLATGAVVTLVDTYAADGVGAEPMRFGDDWVPLEGTETPANAPVPKAVTQHAAPAAFSSFLDAAPPDLLAQTLLSMCTQGGTVLEVGPGAGTLARSLAHRADRLVLGDLSLRAVLRSLSAARAERGASVAGVVLDTEQLPIREGSVRTLVAQNVIDLLHDPAAFLACAHDALQEGGRLLLSTPDPGLGHPEGDSLILEGILDAAGFGSQEAVDGIPWVRAHGSRHYQVYFVRVVAAQRAGADRAMP